MTNLQHPLQRTWAVWADTPAAPAPAPSRGGRGARPVKAEPAPPKRLGNFSTIETMWQWMNNIREPSKTPIDANLYIFEDGVSPTWEDPANVNGGRWLVSIRDGTADAAWQTLYLMLAGETLDADEQVVGIIAAHRRNYIRLSVWTKDKTNDGAVLAVGALAKEALALPTFEYQDHNAGFESFRHKLGE